MFEKPMLISEFPHSGSMFDYYFNMDNNCWDRFDVESEIKKATVNYENLVQS